jgi:DNA-binding beta-propeller fold protein YncE
MIKKLALPFVSLVCVLGTSGAHADAPPHYHLERQVPISGDGPWDYLTFQEGQDRLFVAHGSRVQILDSSNISVIGEIPATEGGVVHGVALAPDLGRGYVTGGRANDVIVFALKSLAVISRVKTTGGNPDGILYEPTTHRIFSFNGRGRNASVIDTSKNVEIGTIPLDSKPEFPATDGQGHVFVNLEDKSSIAVIDPQTMKVTAVWPLKGCKEPSGLAIDVADHRLFSVCDKAMAVVDSNSGKTVANVPIGDGVDATAYDPIAHLVFASGGDGTLTVVHQINPDNYKVVQTLRTIVGARTMALDASSHRIFLVTAKLGPPPPATKEDPDPRPSIVPGTFKVLVVNPQ